MRRGELYTSVRPSTPTNRRTVLVLSGNDVIRPTRAWVLGLDVRPDDPEDLLAVPPIRGEDDDELRGPRGPGVGSGVGGFLISW